MCATTIERQHGQGAGPALRYGGAEALGPGDHACLIYDDPEEQSAFTAAFILKGLRRGERCIYASGKAGHIPAIESMRRGGIDVDGALKSGSLFIVKARDAYLGKGGFDVERMLRTHADSAAAALSAGFKGLWVAGEIDWDTVVECGTLAFMEYESRLSRTLAEARALVVCQYSRQESPPHGLKDAVYTHPFVLRDRIKFENHSFVSPGVFLRESRASFELRRLLDTLSNGRKMAQKVAPRGDTGPEGERFETPAVERLKDDLIGLMSHELRTPLTVIIGALSTLLTEDGNLTQEEVRGLLRDARAEAESLSGLVNNLLEMAHARAGRPLLYHEHVDLAAVARGLLPKLGMQYEEHRFEVDIPEDLPAARADRRRVELVLYNLMDNAAKYSPKDSAVRVFARVEEGELVVGVVDNGEGIGPSDRRKLFTSFQGLGKGPERGEGAGLGLATCRGLVEAHGGRIWVETKPGTGSTFYFSLPLADR